MRELPWKSGPDAAHVAGELAPDGVVPELPSASGEVREAPPVHHHHGIPAGRRTGRNRPPADGRIQNSRCARVDELFHLPPMSDINEKIVGEHALVPTPLRPATPGVETSLDAARTSACATKAPEFWRSLDDLASTPDFQDMLQREFPRQAVGWSDDEDPVEGRRSFLKLMGASLALAGLSACTRQPTEHIMPYVRQPEELVPGRPLFYATAMTLNGVANGVLAESHEGRPTKIEGNPEHPATLGACDLYSQASVLQLYDPDRMQALSYQGEIRGWGDFLSSLREALAQQKLKNGAGIRILTETVTSPVMADQFAAIKKLYPGAKWHQWEPAGTHN